MRTQRIVCILAGLALADGVSGQIATDQAVSVNYLTGHWSSLQPVNLYGMESTPFATPVLAAGWWYRIEGETRELPLPGPSRISGSGTYFRADWDDVQGKGLALSEVVEAFDNERPSGGFSSHLTARNLGATAKTVHFFHYAHITAGGTQGLDTAQQHTPYYVKFSDGSSGDVVRYQTLTRANVRVGALGTVRALLFDSTPSTISGVSGLPFGPGDGEIVTEYTLSLAPGWQDLAGYVVISSRLDSDYVRAATPGRTFPNLLAYDAGADTWYGHIFQRTQSTYGYQGGFPHKRLDALDDFDGDAVSEEFSRDPVSGEVAINDWPLPVELTPGLDWALGSTGDFNGDGKADILWRNTSTLQLELWLMNGRERIGVRVPNPSRATDANWTLAGSADFNGDGHRDLLWRNETSRNVVIWFLDGMQRRLRSAFTTPASAGPGWRVVAVGDFGKGVGGAAGTADLVWQNDTSRRIVVWHMDRAGARTSGVFTTPDTLTVSGGPPQTVVGPR